MALPTRLKRSWLRRIYSRSQANGTDLLTELNVENNSRLDAVASGNSIASVSAGDVSTSWSMQGVGATGMAELCDEMLTLYDTANANLVAAGTAVDDLALFNEMLGLLQPVHDYRLDFTALRG